MPHLLKLEKTNYGSTKCGICFTLKKLTMAPQGVVYASSFKTWTKLITAPQRMACASYLVRVNTKYGGM
jgi:hypothetical protein